jgi:hypothetical protein
VIPNYSVLPWQQLHLSLPTGLTCTFLPETYSGKFNKYKKNKKEATNNFYCFFPGVNATRDNEPHRLVVKQQYASKYSEKASEHFKTINSTIFKEKSRLIRSDGTVIKFMHDNSVEIYYANGCIYRKQDETQPEPADLNTLDLSELEQGTKSKLRKRDQTE